MECLGKVTIFERPVYSVHVPDFAALGALELPSARSVMLLISDAAGVGTEGILAAASRLIDHGVIYLCAWGVDCERVHDIFDLADAGDGSADSDGVVMTTWHSDETLAEAVEFFLTCAFPLDQDLDLCSWVAVTVGGMAIEEVVEIIREKSMPGFP